MIEENEEKFFVVSGARLGRLEVLEQIFDIRHHPLYPETKRSHILHGRLWLCKCDCGKEVLISEWALERRRNKSCGCLRLEITKKNEKERTLNKQYKLERIAINAKIKSLFIEMKFEQLKDVRIRDEKKLDRLSAEIRSAQAKKASLAALYHKNTKRERKKKAEELIDVSWAEQHAAKVNAEREELRKKGQLTGLDNT